MHTVVVALSGMPGLDRWGLKMQIEMAPRKQVDDGGFTIVEVLISSAILFFVATALFGLVSTSTLLSVTAKADSIAVNAANTFLEQVRRLPFDQITQARINTLAAASAVTVDGVAVSITATVTDQWLPGQVPASEASPYRRVAVRVTATGPTGRPFVFNTGTFVGNFTGAAAVGTIPTGTPGVPPVTPPGATPPPVITILSPTPTSGVVRGSSVFMGMDAAAGGPAVSLTVLRITVEGSEIASRTLSGDQTAGVSTNWNTTLVTDGSYPIQFSARDTLGQLTFRQWSLIVDNHPPNPPGTPAITSATGNTAATHTWATAMDGRDSVSQYRFVVNQQSQTAATFAPVGAPLLTNTNSLSASTEAFRRYRFDVISLGPEVSAPMVRNESGPASAFYIARPSFTSTVSVVNAGGNNARARFNVDLSSHTPAFGVSGTINYRWQVRYHTNHVGTQPWADLAGVGSSSPRFNNANWQGPVNGKVDNSDGWVEFRCLVTVTPLGGPQVQVPSSVVRFTRTANNPGGSTRGVDEWAVWTATPATTPAINWGMWP